MTAYLLGVATPFVFVVLLSVGVLATQPGLSIECRCGYSTGTMQRARLDTEMRWRWHRLVRHRTLRG